jgi:hypothetical protein
VKDLIQRLLAAANLTANEEAALLEEAAAALARATAVSLQPAHDQVTIECLNDKVMYLMGQIERLTAGDVELPSHPEPMIMRWTTLEIDAIIDYGNRKDAAGYLRGVLAERERIRELFKKALSDKGTTWPAEVDFLYDDCFKGTP